MTNETKIEIDLDEFTQDVGGDAGDEAQDQAWWSPRYQAAEDALSALFASIGHDGDDARLVRRAYWSLVDLLRGRSWM